MTSLQYSSTNLHTAEFAAIEEALRSEGKQRVFTHGAVFTIETLGINT